MFAGKVREVTSLEGRTRRISKGVLDGAAGVFEASFTTGLVADGCLPLSGTLGTAASLWRCNLGAILTSVFVVRSSAFPLDGGSMLAIIG